MSVSCVWQKPPNGGNTSLMQEVPPPCGGLKRDEVRVPPAHAGGKRSATPRGVNTRITGQPQQVVPAVSMKIAPLLGLHLLLCLFVNPCLNVPDCSRVFRCGSPVMTA